MIKFAENRENRDDAQWHMEQYAAIILCSVSLWLRLDGVVLDALERYLNVKVILIIFYLCVSRVLPLIFLFFIIYICKSAK